MHSTSSSSSFCQFYADDSICFANVRVKCNFMKRTSMLLRKQFFFFFFARIYFSKYHHGPNLLKCIVCDFALSISILLSCSCQWNHHYCFCSCQIGLFQFVLLPSCSIFYVCIFVVHFTDFYFLMVSCSESNSIQ